MATAATPQLVTAATFKEPTTRNAVPGTRVRFSLTIYDLPPLTAKLMRKHAAKLTEMAKMSDATDAITGLDTVVPILLDALNRNYPELTTEQLEEELEVGPEFVRACKIILGAAGYRDPRPGE